MKVLAVFIVPFLAVCATHILPDALDSFRFRRDVSADPHSGEFCVNVSTYGNITYVPTPCKKCHTTLEKHCEEKTVKVCDTVPEVECDIVPFTVCEMKMEQVMFNTSELWPSTFKRKDCYESKKNVTHYKMLPECQNVTKQNCVTKWKTDSDGKQVWDGNEDCEPVTWKECKLVPKKVPFEIPQVHCREVDDEPIPYLQCVNVEVPQMTSWMECEVKYTTNCRPNPKMKCQSISYSICHQEPKEHCKDIDIRIPEQKFEHKKKCLLPEHYDHSYAALDIPHDHSHAASDIPHGHSFAARDIPIDQSHAATDTVAADGLPIDNKGNLDDIGDAEYVEEGVEQEAEEDILKADPPASG